VLADVGLDFDRVVGDDAPARFLRAVDAHGDRSRIVEPGHAKGRVGVPRRDGVAA